MNARRTLVVFAKSIREVRRDLLVVALTLAFAPAFVLLYYAVFPELTPSYTVAVVNQDTGATTADGQPLAVGGEVTAVLESVGESEDEGAPRFRVKVVDTRDDGLAMLDRRECAVVLLLPADFSHRVADLMAVAPADSGGSPPVRPAEFTLSGDRTQPGYAVAAALTDAVLRQHLEQVTGHFGPVRAREEPIGLTEARSEFETYVPGLIVFAVVLLVFLTALMVTREIESGAMRRLRLTRMTAADYLAGTSGAITVVGVAAALVTIGTARLCGFHSAGPLWAGIVVLVLTVLSVIAVGMMVAAVSRTVVRALVIANFPLGLLMFFTGVMLPMPRITWFSIAGHPVGPFEVLAPTHAVAALNKIFGLGEGLPDVLFEISAIGVLSVLYFLAGVALLRRAQRTAG